MSLRLFIVLLTLNRREIFVVFDCRRAKNRRIYETGETGLGKILKAETRRAAVQILPIGASQIARFSIAFRLTVAGKCQINSRLNG